MGKLRILIVDDSVVARRILIDAITADPELESAGSAPNGKIALTKIPQVSPDLVVLDLVMPEMDGLETLTVIREKFPKLPVVMFSSVTRRGAKAAMDAFNLGARDVLAKPESANSEQTLAFIRDELIPKLKAIGKRPDGATSVRLAARPRATTSEKRIEAVTIGVSTGGPNALAEVIPFLPAELPVPVFLVQHMPPMFTRILAERLDAQSKVKVIEATGGESPMAGTVYIAPGDFHLVVERSSGNLKLALEQGPPENSCRPAADVLFRSVVTAYGAGTLGVVLTGMGQDGLRGCEKIKDTGGSVIVQDEATSVVWGMPGFVARADLADKVLPIKEIATEITRLVMKGRPGRSTILTKPTPPSK